MRNVNDLPDQLSDLLTTVGVRFFDEWPQESTAHTLILFRVLKARETHGKWTFSDVEELVHFICETENARLDIRKKPSIDYEKILTEKRPCALGDIPEFWQVRHLAKCEPDVFKGAQRFYQKLSASSIKGQARIGMELKLIEILSSAAHRYGEHNNSPPELKLSPNKAMANIYLKFKNIVNRHQGPDLSTSQNKDRKKIGLGTQSSYKRNNLAKEVLLDNHTSSRSHTHAHHLYTPGWSADGHFPDDKE